MSEQENKDLFDEVDNILSNAFDGKEPADDGFDVIDLPSHAEEGEEGEKDLEETIRLDIQPLVTDVLEVCTKAGFPSQFSFLASSKKVMTTLTFPDKAMQIQGAVCLYLLPHNFAHLVLLASSMPPFHPHIDEISVNKNENLCESLEDKITKLTKKCNELEIAIQWAIIVSRSSESLEVWRGYQHNEDNRNCLMNAADKLYCVGSSLSFEIVTIYNDLFPKEDGTV